jgi:hypothetical protein
MFRRLSAVSLLCAWLCASGAMLDVAQMVAWTRMFQGYARTESLAAAARETFDPAKPCEICRAVSKAREASGRHAPAVPAASGEKMVLIFERCAPFVALSAPRTWPGVAPARAPVRAADVPVPPPRGPAPLALS